MADARDRDGLYSLMTAGVVRWVPVLQVGAADSSSPMDAVATEEPLQVLVGGEPFAVIMRTPGADRELSIGFLLAERVITSAADVQDIRRGPGQPNVMDVTVTDAATARLAAYSPHAPPGDHQLVVRAVRPRHDRVAANRGPADPR